MSYAVSDRKDNELRIDHQVTGLRAALHSKWVVTTVETPLGSWSHFCFLYSYLTGQWRVYRDGVLRAHGALPLSESPLLGHGVYILGQEQDQLGGGFQRDQSYSGEITQLNLWATELANHTIKRVCACSEDVEGSALGWSVMEWRLSGQARTLTRLLPQLCASAPRAFVYFPHRYPINQALHLCQDEAAMAWWTPKSDGMYPYGTKPWTLGSDLCNMDAGHTVNLTLSVCGSGMFTCRSGSCIGLHQRCDLKVDCPDKSDEVQCTLVDILPGYSVNIPPPPLAGESQLSVYFIINILSFPSIATEDLTFVSTMDITMQWKDTRLRYLNLKEDRTLNVVSDEYVSKIWTPQVFFSNAKGNVFTNLDKGSRVECIQEGKPVAGGPDLPEEVSMFAGSENSVQVSQLYSVTYNCDFNLLMFPFDAQACALTFRLVSASAAYLTLVPGHANYSGQINLVEYAIGRLSISSFKDGGFSSVAVQVRFARRYGFYLLTLYIPTILLIFIAYATFFFNPDDFNSRITVCLTALLVLASLYTQTSGSLPKTSYFKLVDVWLFFSIVMMFIIVLLQTLIDFYHQKMFDDNSRVVQYFRKMYTSYCKIMQKFTEENKLTNELSDKDSTPKAKSNGIQIEVKSLEICRSKSRTRSCVSGGGPEAADTDGVESEAARRIPVYGRAVRRIDWTTNQDVNMRLMEKSRVLIPAIFIIFNCTYWGAALGYVNTIDD
ncbi:glycine receptor subunit alpha-2 isoform X2 [Procambarus clarkii]|uniref:glycine receptor subunit alpha-2 isoform X2 n=1 Tax=Procambarus clarkii TaxID=6728 RepID=UPI0037432418